MDIVTWDEKYSLNIARLDMQHRQFFHYLYRLREAILKKESDAAIRQTFKDLAEYAETHFQDEEGMFRLSAFPDLDLQVRHHRYFVAQVRAMKEAYIDAKKLPPEILLNFLADWLRHHILQEDKKYAAFLAGKA